MNRVYELGEAKIANMEFPRMDGDLNLKTFTDETNMFAN
jgi:hypothetical protein